MSSLGIKDDFTIMRLRVEGSKLDPLAVRPRVQQLISEIRLYPLLPESASLFIRKLDDPSPGLLRLEAIDSRTTQAWRRNFNTKFKELVASAARPARGPVSSSAEAVVFLDYSELLACLTADWCNGVVGARWWWHSFLKRGDIEQIVKKLWLEKIEYAPAALQQLAKSHALVEFIGGLSERETHDLIERLIEKFALPAIKSVLESFLQVPMQVRSEKSVASSVSSVFKAEVRHVAPWKHLVPESDTPRLQPAQQLFVGVALMIKRAPAEVRTQSFAREVEQWQEVVLGSSGDEYVATPEVIEPTASIDAAQPEKIVSRHVAEERVNTDKTDQERIESVGIDVGPGEVVRKVVEEVVDPELQTRQVVESFEAAIEHEASIVEAPRESEPTPQAVVEVEESVTIETELGGFFYLINLAIFLEIYSDFTSPVERFTELNIWEFVAIVGDELNEYENAEDPIWSLLARLAGREEDFARKGAKTQSSDLRQPEVFLGAFAPLREETLIWLSSLMPDLRKRLCLALGSDDFSKIVLRHHARVTITATHLDVFFSLAELPIEIRLAGLDRDPGWVPAAGRFIAFHFE